MKTIQQLTLSLSVYHVELVSQFQPKPETNVVQILRSNARSSPHPRLLEFPTLLPLPIMTQHLRLRTKLWLDLPPTFPSSSWSVLWVAMPKLLLLARTQVPTLVIVLILSRFQPFMTIPRIRTNFSTFLSPLKLRYFPIVRLPPRTKGCTLQLCHTKSSSRYRNFPHR